MSHQFTQPPKTVGWWQLGGPRGLSVHQTKRPRWLTRVMCKWLLEWEWIDG